MSSALDVTISRVDFNWLRLADRLNNITSSAAQGQHNRNPIPDDSQSVVSQWVSVCVIKGRLVALGTYAEYSEYTPARTKRRRRWSWGCRVGCFGVEWRGDHMEHRDLIPLDTFTQSAGASEAAAAAAKASFDDQDRRRRNTLTLTLL